MIEVLRKITQKRKEKIQKLGFGFGYEIPNERLVPLNPPKFSIDDPLMIAEIKRSSPSAGKIGEIPNPLKLAGEYLDNGAKVISVLTEEEHFNGSLKDLMEIKNHFKNATILRKDFIQDLEEIEVSYRCGADMVLIIIAMFLDNEELLKNMLLECKKYNITPLVEVHTQEEIDFALKFDVLIMGVNSRNLHTFEIDKIKALSLRESIPLEIKCIFESGIESSFDGYLSAAFGFDGMLCGSYLVSSEKVSDILPPLIKSYAQGKKYAKNFYKDIFKNINTGKILVKICGIMNLDDALKAIEAGADMIGFVMVKKSPRYMDLKSVKEISKALKTLYPHIHKIAVITNNQDEIKQAKELFREGFIDCLQLHSFDISSSKFGSQTLDSIDFNFYPCINFGSSVDYPKNCPYPFVLLDSKSKQKGGSGKSIPIEELKKIKDKNKILFIAGGIGLDNIDDFLSLEPKMLDINSKIEDSVGKKDLKKMSELISRIKNQQGKK